MRRSVVNNLSPGSLPALCIAPHFSFHESALDETARRFRDHLAQKLAEDGFLTDQARVLVTQMLCAFCQGGLVQGVALRPDNRPPAQQKGQKRTTVAQIASRQPKDEPILCLVARFLHEAPARAQEYTPQEQMATDRALAVCAQQIDVLAQSHEWKTILNTSPDSQIQRLFEFHMSLYGYPAYVAFGAALHAGLIARIQQLESQPADTRERVMRGALTSPKALVPIIAEEWLHTVDLTDRDQVRALFKRAAESYDGIAHVTREDYVRRILDLIERGAAFRPFIPRTTLPPVAPTLASSATDLDDEIEAKGFQPFRDSSSQLLPILPDDLEISDSLGGLRPEDLRELEGLGNRDACRQFRFLRSRKVLEHLNDLNAPNVLTEYEIALCYAALMDEATKRVEHKYNQTLQFAVFDTVLHTGRAPKWLASIRLGQRPTLPYTPVPIYDSEFSAIFYVPDHFETIARHLHPPAERTGDNLKIWQNTLSNHFQAYAPIEFVHHLPLQPFQNALFQVLDHDRNQFPGKSMNVREPASQKNATPLFLVFENNNFRLWNDANIRRLFDKINAYAQTLHPRWSAIRLTSVVKSFAAYYQEQGLDPMYTAFLSGNTPESLVCPAYYTLIRSSVLDADYLAAQAQVRSQIAEAFHHHFGKRGLSLLWETVTPSGTQPSGDCLIKIFKGLVSRAGLSDFRVAHDAHVTLLAALLGVANGLRPFESADLSRNALDLGRMQINLHGKSSPTQSRARTVPLLAPTLPLIRRILRDTVLPALEEKQQNLLWVFSEGERLVPATSGLLERIWRQAGLDAGLSDKQIPDLYSLRHYSRSYGLGQKVPCWILNALKGHHVAGTELWNAYLDLPIQNVMETGRNLGLRILAEVRVSAAELEPLA